MIYIHRTKHFSFFTCWWWWRGSPFHGSIRWNQGNQDRCGNLIKRDIVSTQVTLSLEIQEVLTIQVFSPGFIPANVNSSPHFGQSLPEHPISIHPFTAIEAHELTCKWSYQWESNVRAHDDAQDQAIDGRQSTWDQYLCKTKGVFSQQDDE